MKKKCALFLAATNDYIFAAANVIIGALKHSPTLFDDVILFHDGMSERDEAALKKLANIIPVFYDIETFFNKLGNDNSVLPDIQPLKRWTHMSFARYELFPYLATYEHIIYLDFDMLIQSDISPLLDYDLGMVKGAATLNWGLGRDVDDIDGTAINFGSCVITVSDRLPYHDLTGLCYKYTREFYSTLRLTDQPILNYLFAKLNIPISDIGNTYNGNPSHTSSRNAKIMHGFGETRRFWNNQRMILAYQEWHENYKVWLKAGGTPYNGNVYLKDITPQDKGYLVQFLERIHFAHILSENMLQFTSLPLYLNTNFINPKIKFYCHGVSREKFNITFILNSISKFDICLNADTTLPFIRKEVEADESGKINMVVPIQRAKYIEDLKSFFSRFFYDNCEGILHEDKYK